MSGVAILNQPLREVRLYGVLGARFGRVHRLAVGSVREAMQALAVVVPGFERHLLQHSQPGYQVFLGRRGQANVREDRLDAPVSGREAICVVPVVAGAKKAGAFQTILGAALLFFAPYAAGALFATGTAIGTAAAIGLAKFGGTIGLSLLLGGVTQMLAAPRAGSAGARPENQPSYAFDGPVNTDDEGLPVPIAYGRVIVGGARISAGISSDELPVVAAGAGGSGAGGMGAQTLPSWMRRDPIDDLSQFAGS